MYQELFWVIAILIKDINHNNHHDKDDGDHADIDMECGLAGAICQMTSGVRLSDVACHDQCTNLFIGFHLRKTCHDQYAPISLVLIGFYSKTTFNAPIMCLLINPPLSPFNRFVNTIWEVWNENGNGYLDEKMFSFKMWINFSFDWMSSIFCWEVVAGP